MRGNAMDIEGNEVPTLSETFQVFNTLTVEAGTNGYRGGDSGYGGRTVLILKDDGGSDLRCSINGQQTQAVEKIEIVLGGDSELQTFLDGLRFAVKALEHLAEVQKAEGGSQAS